MVLSQAGQLCWMSQRDLLQSCVAYHCKHHTTLAATELAVGSDGSLYTVVREIHSSNVKYTVAAQNNAVCLCLRVCSYVCVSLCLCLHVCVGVLCSAAACFTPLHSHYPLLLRSAGSSRGFKLRPGLSTSHEHMTSLLWLAPVTSLVGWSGSL